MSTPVDRMGDFARTSLWRIGDQAAAWGIRLATWLVVGHAGALLFVLSTFVERKICDQEMIEALLFRFSAGLISAFLAGALGYFSTVYAMALTRVAVASLDGISTARHYVEQAESKGTALDDDALPLKNMERHWEKLEGLPKKFRVVWIFVAISLVLYVVSAGCFLAGIYVPVSTTDSIGMKCDVATSPTTQTM